MKKINLRKKRTIKSLLKEKKNNQVTIKRKKEKNSKKCY